MAIHVSSIFAVILVLDPGCNTRNGDESVYSCMVRGLSIASIQVRRKKGLILVWLYKYEQKVFHYSYGELAKAGWPEWDGGKIKSYNAKAPDALGDIRC